MKNSVYIVVFSVLLLLFTGCQQGSTVETIEPTTEAESVAPEEQVTESEVEEPLAEERVLPEAFDFTLTSSLGEEISLSDYEGKIVFLNFFTTWCVYCDQEMPDFQKVYDENNGDVVFLLVDVFSSEKIDREGVIAWYEERGYTMPMVIDEESVTADLYPVRAFPTTFVVNREGDVFGYLEGAMSLEMVESVIQQIDSN